MIGINPGGVVQVKASYSLHQCTIGSMVLVLKVSRKPSGCPLFDNKSFKTYPLNFISDSCLLGHPVFNS